MNLPRRPLLLILNGDIHTFDPDRPRARALALDRRSGRIVAVGDDHEIRTLAGPLTDTLDAGGRTIIPGLVDAHTHITGYAEARLDVDLRDVRSEDEAVARVRERAARTPAGQWILGQSWDANRWPGGTLPSRATLDGAVPDHPVALLHHSYHAMWVNSQALRAAGITAETPEPEGGTIGRDGAGEPTGLLFEAGAMDLVERVIAPPDDDMLLDELRRVLAEVRARGLTGLHVIEGDRSLRLLQRLRASNELSPRVLFYIPRAALQDAVRLGVRAGFGDDTLRVAGVKLFMDGALGPRTAAMLDPYEGQPEYHGLLTLSETEAASTIATATDHGIGVAIHAIGDRAVRTALNAIEATMRAGRLGSRALPVPARRFRLEHVQLAAPEDITRMAHLGVVASVQPFHAVVDRDAAERAWGTRHRRAYAYNTLRQAGIPLALGSDVPVDTCDPWRVIHAAVMRRDDRTPERSRWLPEHALTVTQALWAYTVGAAYAGGQEEHQGTLTPGKLADLLVLAEDPFSIPPERLADMQVTATLVGGELVHGTLA
jgi:predicted amidohydrolase YtcJ